MSTPSINFKTMLCTNDKSTRHQILTPLLQWLLAQTPYDPLALACYSSLKEIYQTNTWADDEAFKNHFFWRMMQNYDTCVSFQEIVNAKLTVPDKNMAVAVEPRKN